MHVVVLYTHYQSVSDCFQVVVDALFGFSFKGAPRPPFDSVLATLRNVKAPIAAVDVPSGQSTVVGWLLPRACVSIGGEEWLALL